MKAIIYAGIGLFSVASVYGVADYYSSQKSGALKTLYQEEAVITPAEEKPIPEINQFVEVKKEWMNSPTEKKTIAKVKATKKLKAPKRTLRFSDFSRGRIVEKMPVVSENIEMVKETPVQTEPINLVVQKATTEVVEPVIIKKEPERKINLEMFSRAPLRKSPKTTVAKIKKD